jgi:hypothetical protein
MNRVRTTRLLAVVLLVMAGGCSGLASDDAAGGSPTSAGPASAGDRSVSDTGSTGEGVVTVSGGELSYDGTQVWRRVQVRLGTEYEPPEVVVRANPAGMYYRDGAVYVDPRYAEAQTQALLAHEYAHYIHDRTVDALSWPTVTGPDEAFAFAAYKEGFARQVERWYIDEHAVGVPDELPLAESSPERRWYWARYRFGHDYVASRLSTTNGLLELADGPWPNTSEQLIHPDVKGTEPPASLVVDTPNGTERAYTPRSERRMGEMAVRIAVWSRTNATAARRAGSGWGADRFLAFVGPDGTGTAWVIRYDNASAASEARSLFEAYGSADPRSFESPSDHVACEAPPERFVTTFWRGDTARSFRTELVGEEALVVLVGPETFVGNVTASGTSGEVVLGTNATRLATSTS